MLNCTVQVDHYKHIQSLIIAKSEFMDLHKGWYQPATCTQTCIFAERYVLLHSLLAKFCLEKHRILAGNNVLQFDNCTSFNFVSIFNSNYI